MWVYFSLETISAKGHWPCLWLLCWSFDAQNFYVLGFTCISFLHGGGGAASSESFSHGVDLPKGRIIPVLTFALDLASSHLVA